MNNKIQKRNCDSPSLEVKEPATMERVKNLLVSLPSRSFFSSFLSNSADLAELNRLDN